MTPIQETALAYIYHGWAPIPLRHGTKRPELRGWPNLKVTQDQVRHYFVDPCNIGVILGTASGWLVDIDLDCPEAIKLAPRYLPPTDAVFGRHGAPRSHYLYYAPGAEPTKYADDAGKTILEIRSTGQQTMFPGSIHPNDEPVEWCGEAPIPQTVCTRILQICVERLARACEAVR